MADRNPQTASNAAKAAGKRRRQQNESDAPLSVTQDHIRQFKTVYPIGLESARQIPGHRTNTITEYQTYLFMQGITPAFKPVSVPLPLLSQAEWPPPPRAQCPKRRRPIEAIVSWGEDANTSLGIQPIDDCQIHKRSRISIRACTGCQTVKMPSTLI